MTDTRPEPILDSSVGRVMYYLALLLVALPAIDFIANVLPLQFGQVQWRYGTVGLLSGFLLTPVLGLMIAGFVAAWSRHAGVLRFLGFLNLISGVLLIVVTALWVLDFLEVRGAIAADARRPFEVGSIKALGKNVAVALGLVWLGLASFRLRRSILAGARPRSDEFPLVFGKGKQG